MDDSRPPAVGAPDPDVRSEPPAAPAGSTRLVRSRRDQILGGVCGGLGRYLGVDPVLVRIVAVALVLSVGVGVLAYVIAWIVIPEAGEDEPPVAPAPTDRHRVAVVAGGALIGLGVLLLVRALVPWFDGVVFWPLVVIGVGVLVVVSSRR
jgi:phage shock protein C